ncbi:MAG: hypothetical protein AABY04_03840 [Candidatus Micrarchaeota archaeon]|mgnify:CR=1 FL=1
MDFDLDLMKKLFPPKKALRTLKWGFPESRYSAPVEDVEKKIPLIKKGCKFAGGGEFMEEVHAKEYGEGVYAYFIVRADKKTEEETIFSDAYMLREDDKLGFDVQSSFKISENLDKMGYRHIFDREITVWSFRLGLRAINAFEITDFGGFIEIGLPATKIATIRESDEKWVKPYFEKLGIKKEDVVPTDVITLQLMSMMQSEQEGQKEEQPKDKGKPGKSMGMGKGGGNLF